MRTKFRAALSVLVVLAVAGLGPTGCGCTDGTSASMAESSMESFGNEADARAPKPKPNKKDKPCKKGSKNDTRSTKADTRGINRGGERSRHERRRKLPGNGI